MKNILGDLKFNHMGLAVKQEKDALAMLESLNLQHRWFSTAACSQGDILWDY